MVARNCLVDLAVRIIEVAEDARARDAGSHARRRVARILAVPAEAALLHHAGGFLHDAGVVGTRGHAVLASDALLRIHQHHAGVGDVGGVRRAHGGAGRVFAVHALGGHDLVVDVGVLPRLDLVVLDERLPRFQMVLHLAGDAAGRAADALLRVDQHSVAGHVTPPPSSP